jgi:hypothetical protein
MKRKNIEIRLVKVRVNTPVVDPAPTYAQLSVQQMQQAYEAVNYWLSRLAHTVKQLVGVTSEPYVDAPCVPSGGEV